MALMTESMIRMKARPTTLSGCSGCLMAEKSHEIRPRIMSE
jgi:hypothetical protein